MKRYIIAFVALAMFSFVTVSANAIPTNQDAIVKFVQDTRTEIQYENLPEAVKTTFEETHSEADVTSVYEVKTEDATHYEIMLSDDTTVKYDAEGNEIVE